MRIIVSIIGVFMKICIYGSASENIADVYKSRVYELSKKMAERGHSLVYGGGGHGVMGASARGTKAGNGDVLGFIPRFFQTGEIEEIYDECTSLIYTKTMHDRKELMEENSEAFIIAPGGIGTYDELFSVLTNKQLGRHVCPIILFNIDGFYDKLDEFLKIAIQKNFIRENVAKLYKIMDDIDEILDYIENSKEEKLSDLKDG